MAGEVMGPPRPVVGEEVTPGTRSFWVHRSWRAAISWKKKKTHQPGILHIICFSAFGLYAFARMLKLSEHLLQQYLRCAVPRIAHFAGCTLDCVHLPGRSRFKPLRSHIAAKTSNSQALWEKGRSNRAINSTNNTIKPRSQCSFHPETE